MFKQTCRKLLIHHFIFFILSPFFIELLITLSSRLMGYDMMLWSRGIYSELQYLDMYLLILWGMRYQVPNEVAGHLFSIDTHLHISNPCDVCFAVASVSMDNLVTLLSFCCKSRISALKELVKQTLGFITLCDPIYLS